MLALALLTAFNANQLANELLSMEIPTTCDNSFFDFDACENTVKQAFYLYGLIIDCVLFIVALFAGIVVLGIVFIIKLVSFAISQSMEVEKPKNFDNILANCEKTISEVDSFIASLL